MGNCNRRQVAPVGPPLFVHRAAVQQAMGGLELGPPFDPSRVVPINIGSSPSAEDDDNEFENAMYLVHTKGVDEPFGEQWIATDSDRFRQIPTDIRFK